MVNTNTPSNSPVDQLLAASESGQQNVITKESLKKYTAHDLDQLQYGIETSQKMTDQKKEELKVIINEQRKLLLLKTQLPSGNTQQQGPTQQPNTQTNTQQTVEKTFWNPLTWTPEERTKAARIAVIGGAVVGGLILLRSISNAIGKTVEKVEEKTKGFFGTLKFLAVAGLLTAGAYFGISKLAKVQEHFNTIVGLQKKIDEMKAAAQNAPEAMRQALEARIAEAEQQMEELKKPAVVKAAEKTVETAKDKLETGKNIALEQAKKLEREHQAGINGGIAYTIVFFDKQSGNWQLGENSKIPQIQDVINAYSSNGEHGTTTMQTILQPDFTFATSDDDDGADNNPANRKQAGSRLQAFCEENYDTLLKSLSKKMPKEKAEQTIKAMTLPEYLRAVIANYGGLGDMIKEWKEQGGTLQERLKNLQLGTVEGVKKAMQQEVEHTLRDELHLSETEMNDFNYTEFFKALVGVGEQGTARKAVAPAGDNPQEKAVAYILEKLKTGDTYKYMLPCFHGTLPMDAEMNGKSDVEKVQFCLLDRMPVSQAMRCYFYAQMIKSGNPAGLALMQVEVLAFIRSSEKNVWDKMDKYDVIDSLVKKAAMQTPEQLVEEWKKLQANVDEETVKKATTVLGRSMEVLGSKVVETAWDSTFEAVAAGLSFGKNNFGKILGIGLTASGVTTTAGYLAGVNTAIMDTALDHWASQTRINTTVQHVRNGWNRMLFGPSIGSIQNAAREFRIISEAMKELPLIDEELNWLFQSCANTPKNAEKWAKLAHELGIKGYTEASHAADAIAKNRSTQHVLYLQRYVKGSRWWMRPFHWVNHKMIMPIAGSAAEKTLEAGNALYNSPLLRDAIRKLGTTGPEILALIQRANIPGWMATAFSRTAGGVNMLINAAKTGGAPALAYLVKLGSYAGKTAFVGAAGFDIVVSAIEIVANKARIANEDNPAIKELYALRNNISYAQMGVGAISLGSAFTSLWAPAAAVGATWLALPLAGLFAVKHAHDELESVSATWLSEEKDWGEKTSGSILNSLEKLGPGNITIWQNLAAGNSRVETFGRWSTMSKEDFAKWQAKALALPEQANEGQRFLATRAYVAQMTEIEPQPGETEDAFRERFATFQRLQIGYIADVTQGAFDSKYMLVYRDAQTHAELMTLAETLKKTGQSMPMDIGGKTVDLAQYADYEKTDSFPKDITRGMVIAAYQKQGRLITMIQLEALKGMQGSTTDTESMQDGLLQNALLIEVRHDINLCEKNMQNADYQGWKTTGYEEQARDRARFAMNNGLRLLLREEADRLRATNEATIDNFDASVACIRTYLQRDPLEFEKDAQTQYHEAGARGLKDMVAEETKKLQEQTGRTDIAAGTQFLTDYHSIRSRLYVIPPKKATATPILASNS